MYECAILGLSFKENHNLANCFLVFAHVQETSTANPQRSRFPKLLNALQVGSHTCSAP